MRKYIEIYIYLILYLMQINIVLIDFFELLLDIEIDLSIS